MGLAERAADRVLQRRAGSSGYVAEVLSDPDRTNDFRHARARALPDRDRPRHDRAHRPRRGRVGRRADLHRRSPPRRALPMRLRAGRAARAASSSTAASARRPTSTSRSSAAPSSSSSSTRSCRTSTTSRKRIPTIFGDPVRRVSDMGVAGDRQPVVPRSSPTTACTARSRTGRQSFPGVDIILIEPEPDDELMFGTSILDYSAPAARSPSTASSRSRSSSRATTTATRRSPSATASRSRPAACATSSTRSSASAASCRPGAGCSSRRPPRCCASSRATRSPGG